MNGIFLKQLQSQSQISFWYGKVLGFKPIWISKKHYQTKSEIFLILRRAGHTPQLLRHSILRQIEFSCIYCFAWNTVTLHN